MRFAEKNLEETKPLGRDHVAAAFEFTLHTPFSYLL